MAGSSTGGGVITPSCSEKARRMTPWLCRGFSRRVTVADDMPPSISPPRCRTLLNDWSGGISPASNITPAVTACASDFITDCTPSSSSRIIVSSVFSAHKLLPRHDLPLGLPDLPYFTGDPVFQTLSPASRGELPGRTNLPYSVSQIITSLRRHCDT